MHDSPHRYGLITRLLHWITALLVLVQFTRFIGGAFPKEHWLNSTIKPLHASLGFTLLVIVILRVLWMIKQRHQRPTPQGKFSKLAKAGHHLLYLVGILLPVTGISYIVGKGYALKVFDTQLIAGTGQTTDWLVSVGSLHAPLTWLFLATVIAHLLMALYHHFIVRDDTLKRMV